MLKILKVFTVTIFILLNTAAAGDPKIDIDKVRKAIVTINSRIPVSAYGDTVLSHL